MSNKKSRRYSGSEKTLTGLLKYSVTPLLLCVSSPKCPSGGWKPLRRHEKGKVWLGTTTLSTDVMLVVPRLATSSILFLFDFCKKSPKSRPIKMRTPILYLANRWTKFKMLLTSNRFLYLIRFLLLSFPLIPQFIAQFRSICLFLCSSPYFLPVATKWELEQSMHCPLCHCCHSFLFSPSERTKWRSKKVLKSLS